MRLASYFSRFLKTLIKTSDQQTQPLTFWGIESWFFFCEEISFLEDSELVMGTNC